MDYIQGVDRKQVTLLPDCLDDFVAENHLVRFIDLYVDSLDLVELGFQGALLNETGRPPYQPKDLLKIYLYGQFYRIRSSRALQRETHRNLEVMWLVNRLQPDFRTLADFRKNNKKAIQKLAKAFSIYCLKLGLIEGDWVAIDGSKFKAVNALDKCYTEKRIQRLSKKLDQVIESYYDTLDKEDEKEAGRPPFLVENAKSKREALLQLMKEDEEKVTPEVARALKKREKLDGIATELESSDKSQISLTDEDARMMQTRRGKVVGYNVQTAVDGEHKMIVACEVVQTGADQGQLKKMVERTQEVLGHQDTPAEKGDDKNKGLKIVADKGYYNEELIGQASKDAEINVPVPIKANPATGLYPKSEFTFDRETDSYTCPAGKTLALRAVRKKCKTRIYQAKDCPQCPLKPQCTTGKRQVRRSKYANEIDDMQTRMETNDAMFKRKTFAEHPFGTLKYQLGLGTFLTKGLAGAKAEISLGVMTYNMKRAINILGIPKLIESLGN